HSNGNIRSLNGAIKEKPVNSNEQSDETHPQCFFPAQSLYMFGERCNHYPANGSEQQAVPDEHSVCKINGARKNSGKSPEQNGSMQIDISALHEFVKILNEPFDLKVNLFA